MIEAKEAKRIAWRNTHKHVITQYNVISKLIQDAAEDGQTELVYPCELYEEVSQALYDYGYKISYCKNTHDLTTKTIISWE